MDQAEISRRLKAGRWLAGGVNANGKPQPLSSKDLARQQVLVDNRISANRLEEIEQLKTTARAVELPPIAEALGLPGWFGPNEARPELVAQSLRRLADEVDRVHRPAGEEPQSEPVDMDRRRASAEGDAA